MKQRPKIGDWVEFRSYGKHIGEVTAIATTGVHFQIKIPTGRYKMRRVGLSSIVRILSEEEIPEVQFE